MPVSRPGCAYWAPQYRRDLAHRLRRDTSRTANQKLSLFIQHVLAHEFGHTIGLRHNFEGSLVPPSSSVMDYLDDFTDALDMANPGQYDRDAVRYLYGLSPDLPEQPFCTDEDLQVSPICQIFDSGASPLYDWWVPNYQFLESLILDLGLPVDFLDSFYLNEVLEFARDVGFVDPVQRTDAIRLAFDRTAVPMSAADASDPVIVASANLMADFVLRRIVLDDSALRGFIEFDLSDPDVIALVAAQAGRMLRNEDGARTFELRRTTVDVLKRLQSDSAFLELRASRDTVQGALDGGTLYPAEVPFVEDHLTRIQVALTPYFD